MSLQLAQNDAKTEIRAKWERLSAWPCSQPGFVLGEWGGHGMATSTDPEGHTQPAHSRLIYLRKSAISASKQVINSNLNQRLKRFLFITGLHGLGWDFSGQLVCVSSLLLLRAGLCHNIIFHTLVPLTAHPSFLIIASNKYWFWLWRSK